MTTLITDPQLEERLKEERHVSGADQHDEVWEGVYVMAPLANNEHQEIVGRLVVILGYVVEWPGLGKVTPGVNLAGFAPDWQYDYRAPDVVVFLEHTRATNYGTHWRGAADFIVEIVSPGDRSREKIPFYSHIGVRELLIVDRQPWTIELYRHGEGQLEKIGQSIAQSDEVLTSQSVPLTFRLVPGDPRPQIEVVHPESGRRWLI
jgi:Uma2 family endonuclease